MDIGRVFLKRTLVEIASNTDKWDWWDGETRHRMGENAANCISDRGLMSKTRNEFQIFNTHTNLHQINKYMSE